MDKNRRLALKLTQTTAVTTLALAYWAKPIVNAVVLPAHAQTSPPVPSDPIISDLRVSTSASTIEPGTLITINLTLSDEDTSVDSLVWTVCINGVDDVTNTGQFTTYTYTIPDTQDASLLIEIKVNDPTGNMVTQVLYSSLIQSCFNFEALPTFVADEYFVSPTQVDPGTGAPPPSLSEINASNREASNIYFGSSTSGGMTSGSDLTSTARAGLAVIAQALVSFPMAAVTIEGHTAECNDNQSNLVLGQQRADAVANALIMNGVNSNQLRTVSFGEERPFCVSSDLDCWKSNSRARIVLTASG